MNVGSLGVEQRIGLKGTAGISIYYDKYYCSVSFISVKVKNTSDLRRTIQNFSDLIRKRVRGATLPSRGDYSNELNIINEFLTMFMVFYTTARCMSEMLEFSYITMAKGYGNFTS